MIENSVLMKIRSKDLKFIKILSEYIYRHISKLNLKYLIFNHALDLKVPSPC